MNTIGSLSVSADYTHGSLSRLDVCLERPPVAGLFLGQAPAAVVRTVPYLYSLCAQAQGLAARAALAAAQGENLPAPEPSGLWAEALHEHLWRLLLDWPSALGLAPAKEAFIAWRAARTGGNLAEATFALLENTLLGCPVPEWQRGERPVAGSLATLCLARLEPLENTQFFDQPPLTPSDWLSYWRGERQEAPGTPFPSSVAAAWRHRLEAVLGAAQALQAGAAYPVAAAGGAGWGIGQTSTARGVLTHGVELEGERVKAYRVWAPTDCHFADAAALAALLGKGSWPGQEAAKQALTQAVLALDPCLPYTVKVNNA